MKTSVRAAGLLFSIALWGSLLHAQVPDHTAEHCRNLARGSGRADALESACQFAVSAQQKLPNYICEERVKRWEERWGDPMRLLDVIDVQVAIEDGKDSYSNVRRNGKSLPSSDLSGEELLHQIPGMWTLGEFGTQLLQLFAPENRARFEFEKEVRLNSRPALLFSFTVREDENRSFYLWHLDGKEWNPGYSGSLWLDKSTLRPVRLEMSSSEVDSLVSQNRTDYKDIPLTDSTTFLLPVRASVKVCKNPVYGFSQTKCISNDLQFSNCHKFRVQTRILGVERRSSGTREITGPLKIELEL